MVRPDDLVGAVIRSLKRSGRLPEAANYMDHEPAINTEAVKLPVVAVSPETQVRVSETNSDLVGYKEDDDGNRVGRIYQSLYELPLNVAVWTAQDSRYDARELGQAIRDTLYEHDTKAEAADLHYDDGEPIDELWRFRVSQGEHTNDLTTSPPLRRWQQNITLSASEQYVVTPEEAPVSGYTL